MGKTIWIILSIIVVLILLLGAFFLFKQEPSINNNQNQQKDNIIDANNQLAMDLYSKYKSKDENLFYSSYSISSALAMTYEGAKGKTAEEMLAVLHLPKDKEKIRLEYNKIYNEINNVDKEYTLNIA